MIDIEKCLCTKIFAELLIMQIHSRLLSLSKLKLIHTYLRKSMGYYLVQVIVSLEIQRPNLYILITLQILLRGRKLGELIFINKCIKIKLFFLLNLGTI